MADPLDLVTSQAATQFLTDAGLSAPSDLAAIITGVSVAMQSYASRTFGSQSYSIALSGQGADRASLPNTPITAVSALSIDGVAVPASSGPTQMGYVFSDTQVLLRGYRFSRGVQNVALTYTAGFVSIPMDVQRAACEGVAAVVASLGYTDPRAIEVKAGGSSVKLGSVAELSKVCLTANVTAVLDQLKRVVPC